MTGREYLARVRGQAKGLGAPACLRCGRRAAPARLSCWKCLALANARASRARAEKKAAGLCAHSGCHERAAEGLTLCNTHRGRDE